MSLSIRIAAPTTGAILVLFSGLALAAFLCRRSKAAVKKSQLSSPHTMQCSKGPMGSQIPIFWGREDMIQFTLYRGTVQIHGVLVAVKVFDLQQPGSCKSFQAGCEALRRVRHRCLVKVITSCATTTKVKTSEH